jgi:hypothetical protein
MDIEPKKNTVREKNSDGRTYVRDEIPLGI